MYLLIVKGRLSKDRGETKEARALYDEALTLAHDLEDIFMQKNVYNLIATSYELDGNHMLALPIFEKAMNIKCHPDSMACLRQDVKIRFNQSAFYRSLDSIEQAIESLDLADQLMKSHNINDSLYVVCLLYTSPSPRDS